MVECKSRGAYLCGVTTYGKYEVEDTLEFAIHVSHADINVQIGYDHL